MKSEVTYPTSRFKCWDKGKMLSKSYYDDIPTAKEKGKLLVFGCGATPYFLLAGFDDYVFFSGEPYGATIAADRAFFDECTRAYESKGYPHDHCSYYRNVCGSMFLDKYVFGGPFPKPDFIWSGHFCPVGHPKSHQIIAEYLNIPFYFVDDDLHHHQKGTPKQMLDYITGQYLDSLEWMEKLTGRPFNVEKAAAAMQNSFKCEALWGEILLLNQAIPAPTDFKSLMAFLAAQMFRKGDSDSVEFLEELRDEIKERIADGIAAVPNERTRLVMYSSPPWGSLRLFRSLEKKGVVILSNFLYSSWTWAQMDYRDDGSVLPTKLPEERGWPPVKTREDLVQTYVRWRLEHKSNFLEKLDIATTCGVNFVKHLKADGMILVDQLACLPNNLGFLDYKLAFEKAGIPVTTVAFNFADPRENDDAKIVSRIETFVESIERSR